MVKTSLNNVDYVVIAAFKAGASREFVDTEDIAKIVSDLVPGKFRWRKYNDQIDLESVRKRLYDSRKEGQGSRMVGSDKQGWSLTSNGLQWIKANQHIVETLSIKGGEIQIKRVKGKEGQRYIFEKNRILNSSAYEKYSRDEFDAIEIREINDLFRVDEYTTEVQTENRITKILDLFLEDEYVFNLLNTILQLKANREAPNEE